MHVSWLASSISPFGTPLRDHFSLINEQPHLRCDSLLCLSLVSSTSPTLINSNTRYVPSTVPLQSNPCLIPPCAAYAIQPPPTDTSPQTCLSFILIPNTSIRMHAKTIFAATFVALAQFAVASPPGCLLGAVNSYEDPADIEAVCKDKDLSSKIEKICGDDASAAMSAMADICKEKGVKVDTASKSPSPSKTGSGAHAAGTASAGIYPTGSGGNSTVPTVTGGPAAPPGGAATGTSTGDVPGQAGAASRLEMGVAAILAGFVAVAL